ncbi:cell division protein FtsX [Xanthobacter sp. TB0136]|uniref:cell division protein FtsX n=1 Tax=Xanthobacter sp. TB0136 TaxID=3459177 RepID=UPI0040394E1B
MSMTETPGKDTASSTQAGSGPAGRAGFRTQATPTLKEPVPALKDRSRETPADDASAAPAAEKTAGPAVTPAAQPTAKPRPMTPIVPRSTISGRALIAVVAIMTFLASITVGAALAVRSTAGQWRSDVTREVTIQIRAGDPKTTDAQVQLAAEIARNTPGVADTHILTADETGRLLEPWLGSGLELEDLPVPRMVVVRLDNSTPTDLNSLKRKLSDQIPTATLDDHRMWAHRLSAMAEGVTWTGIGLLALVGVATVLTVVFATRAAVATNRTVVEVLHFVGAKDGFIAAQFQRHFLKIGAQGGLLGGVSAAVLFAIIAALPRFGIAGEPDNPSILVWLNPGIAGFIGIALVVLGVALATAYTSRVTVYRTLRTIQ